MLLTGQFFFGILESKHITKFLYMQNKVFVEFEGSLVVMCTKKSYIYIPICICLTGQVWNYRKRNVVIKKVTPLVFTFFFQ